MSCAVGIVRDAGAADVFSFELNVQSREAVEAAIAALPDAWRAIDVLVNNAGLSRGLKKLYEDDVQDWEEMIDTNIKGLLYVTRAVVPGMVERRLGHIINLGSIAGHIVYPNGAVYCATKAAELFISDGLRIDLNGTPVRVTSIDPGMAEALPRYGEPQLIRPRLGQGAFRVLVTDIYNRRCAVTHERTLPALEAAHIRPYGDGGEHEAPNGMLFRRDIHSLFDAGYVTVTPDLHFEVSRRIKEEFDNGRHYYELHGKPVFAPVDGTQRPDPEALRWHNEHAFRG